MVNTGLTEQENAEFQKAITAMRAGTPTKRPAVAQVSTPAMRATDVSDSLCLLARGQIALDDPRLTKSLDQMGEWWGMIEQYAKEGGDGIAPDVKAIRWRGLFSGLVAAVVAPHLPPAGREVIFRNLVTALPAKDAGHTEHLVQQRDYDVRTTQAALREALNLPPAK